MIHLKPPITYYGGKQQLRSAILPLIPEHKTYIEPFVGGGAVFWAKNPSEIEILNDNNRELINFYEVIQVDFQKLERLIRKSLHSRSLHSDATVIYNNPHLFNRVQRAWAVWVLALQSFGSKLNDAWGYNKSTNVTPIKVWNRRKAFTVELTERLHTVQVECRDALRVIHSYDYPEAFFFCDPPYHNANCGHYNKYNIEDFNALLKSLETVQGKFLLSSYPSEILSAFTSNNEWYSIQVSQPLYFANGKSAVSKKKMEVLTANYDFHNL